MPKSVDLLESVDISTRPKRRRAIARIIGSLERIREFEEAYLERIPLNLQDSEIAAAADDSVSYLVDAICSLSDAY